MTQLYLIRHGETEFNKYNKIQGKLDTKLSEVGLVQAELLSKRLSSMPIDIIYTSSLKRAKNTAEIIARRNNVPLIESDDYHEIGLGLWQGLTLDEIMENHRDIYRTYKDDPINFVLEGAETFEALCKRVLNGIKTVLAHQKGKNIMLVSHSITIKMMLVSLLDLELKHYKKFRIDNASISIIAFPDDTLKSAAISLLNDTGHLKPL